MASLLEKKSFLWTLIGVAAVILIVVIGSAIGGRKPSPAPAEPTPTQTTPASQSTPAEPAPTPQLAPSQPPAVAAPTIDTSLKAAEDALSAYTAQSGDLSGNALDTQAPDLDAAALKLSP